MSIKYIQLPIYSISVFGEYLYFAGGGGGSTGIPNEIKIFHKAISNNPIGSVDTGRYIIENLTVSQERKILVCNANQFLVVYSIQEEGKSLIEKYRFQVDKSPKNGNVNALCLGSNGQIAMSGCEDMSIRFHKLLNDHAEPVHEYALHTHQVKSVDHNSQDLYVSTDNHLIAVCSLSKKQILRTLHQDMVMPEKTLFRSAHFIEKGGDKLIISHFEPRTTTYVTKELKGKMHTVEVTKDQVSVTYYHPQHKLLGIGCAKGITTMVSASDLSILGEQNCHNYGVNACFISKKKFLLTGTSNCSYHFQPPEGSLSFPLALIVTILLSGLFIFLMGSNSFDPTMEL